MTVSPAQLSEPSTSSQYGASGALSEAPCSAAYDDVYFPGSDAWAQAQAVFLAGNGLPTRWQARSRFVILETGFGLGNNFLATWSAWRNDPQRCDQLTFMSLDKHPLRRADMARVHPLHTSDAQPDHRTDERAELARRLLAAWPPLTPGWHHMTLEERRGTHGQTQHVRLMLGLGDIAELLPSLIASVDAFYLDGFKPASNPEMWAPELLSRLNRLAAPGATAATWSSARMVRDALSAAQFHVEKVPGQGGKFHSTKATFAPRFVPPPAPGGLWPEPAPEQRHALVIGAGLAGTSATWSLARQGWRVTLLDAAEGPAQGASGNPGGLFHSIIHTDDGLHARAHRAAALATWARVHAAIDSGDIPGDCRGLLRLDDRTSPDALQALQLRHPWLAEQAQWLSQTETQNVSGMAVPSGGWLFHQAGWLQPGAYARWLLSQAQASGHVQTRWFSTVERIQYDAARGVWQAMGADHQVLAEAPSLVLANASQAQALLDTLPHSQATAALPTSPVRGQITVVPADGAHQRMYPPKLPVAGSGYALTLPDGRLLCGATTQHHDLDPALRATDHGHNLAQAQRLGALAPELANDLASSLDDGNQTALTGRVGWRATTPDRLPLVGALPWHPDRLAAAAVVRREQARMLPRERSQLGGLYVLGGLGSRGITWAALAGELLAHWVTGSPCPVEAELRDALDPARFSARQHRQ